MSRYKSDKYKSGKELIPTVIVQFHSMADLWMTKKQYDDEGRFKGLLKSFSVSIKDIANVWHVLKYPSSYPTTDWEG